MQDTNTTITISHYHEVTARVPSFLKVPDKFGYISYSHFFSDLEIDSGRLEILEALYLFFHWTAFSLKCSQFIVS